MKSRRRAELLLRVGVAGTSLVVSLILAELWLRLYPFNIQYRFAMNGKSGTVAQLLLLLDPQLLYTVKGNSDSDINAEGFREREFTPKKPGTKRILLIGDSFLMANDLPAENMISRRLEARLGQNVEVLNLSVAGYGPDQEYLQLKKYAPRLEPDLIVVVLYPRNDFDDLWKNELFELRDGALVPTKDNPVLRAMPRFRVGALFRRLFTGRHISEAVEKELQDRLWRDPGSPLEPDTTERGAKVRALLRAILVQMKGVADSVHTPFAVAVLPPWFVNDPVLGFKAAGTSHSEFFSNEETALSMCHAVSQTCIDIVQPFVASGDAALMSDNYRHLTKAGTDLVAQLLADELRRTFCFEATNGASNDRPCKPF